MTPTLGGTISSSFFSTYQTTVNAALATGAYVIVDLHNYARWNGGIIGQGGPTNAQYASIWSQLAAKFKGNSKGASSRSSEKWPLTSLQSSSVS
jgi:endoglucanase